MTQRVPVLMLKLHNLPEGFHFIILYINVLGCSFFLLSEPEISKGYFILIGAYELLAEHTLK